MQEVAKARFRSQHACRAIAKHGKLIVAQKISFEQVCGAINGGMRQSATAGFSALLLASIILLLW